MRGACALIALLVCVCLLVGTERPADALDPRKQISQYMHRRWDAEQDLPVNTATALFQSADGYLWIGSQEGLVRYDGVTFTTFDGRNTPCLKDEWILHMAGMPDGTVWVIPMRGAPFVMKNGVFVCDPMPEGAPRTLIKAIVPARGGGAWFGAFGKGVFLIKDGRVVRSYRGAPFDRLSSAKVLDVVLARDGALWVATDGGGVNRIAPDGEIAVFGEENGLSSNATTKLLEARDGTIWVGTAQGVATISKDRVTHITAMPSLVVSMVVEDRDGAMWFGTEDGLYRLYNGEVRAHGRRGGSVSETVQVRALLEDREGNLWMGSNGGGIERFSDGPFTPFTSMDGLSDDFVWIVYEDEPGRIWIGTDAGGLNRLEHGVVTVFGRAEGLGDDTVRSILRGRDGTLWVGTLRDGLQYFDGSSFTPVASDDPRCDSDISAIAETAAGELWVAARNRLASHGATGVVCRLERGKLRVISHAEGGIEDFLSCMRPARDGRMLLCGSRGLHIIDRGRTTSYSMRDGLTSNYVTSVYEDADGVLWIGTAQSGLFRFKDGVFAHATTAQGMFDDKTYGIVEDDSGYLWLSSSRGISRVHKRDLDDLFAGRRTRIEPAVYGSEHGMRTAECNGGAQFPAWRAKDGRLWFATMKGVVVVDPRHVEPNRLRPQVIIERLAADGVDWIRDPERDLAPGTRALEFSYTATSLIASNRIRFRYMLEGFDSTWVDAASRRTAYYTNLPPGAYRFRVIAANSGGLWNREGASIAFSVQAHLYQTWWFLLASILSGFGLIFTVHRVRVQRLRSRERELQLRVEERTHEIAQAAEALRASESYSRAIVGTMGEGIITFDRDGRISRWNAAAERIFAYTSDEAVGNTAALLGLGAASGAVPSAPASVFERARRKDASAIPVEIHATAATIDGHPTTIWLVRDLTEARRAEAKVAAMQRELVAASRRAGMAQVATSVLHNVGNALTSVNLSAELVLANLKRSKVVGLGKAAAMLDREPTELATFLQTDQGRRLPAYLVKVNEVIQDEHKAAINELESLGMGIEHIKAIVSAQQSHGKVAGVFESVSMSELLNDAVRLERGPCEMAGITVRVDHADMPPARVDRHRLIEIVMNLLVNARQALGEVASGERREILVRSRSLSPGTFSIQVSDTGMGIAPENLVRIFHQGFTTKADGHGFGLHSSSCAAIELGGRLFAESEGPGKGACFTLTLPIDGSAPPPRTIETNSRPAAEQPLGGP